MKNHNEYEEAKEELEKFRAESEQLYAEGERKIVDKYSEFWDSFEMYAEMPSLIRKIFKKFFKSGFNLLEENVRGFLYSGIMLKAIGGGFGVFPIGAFAMQKDKISLAKLLDMQSEKPLFHNIRKNLIQKLKDAGVVNSDYQ